MTPTIWDAAMAAVGTKLAADISGVTISSDRRAAPPPAQCPLLVLTQGDIAEDLEMSPGEAFHRIEVMVTGYCTGTSDTACRTALNTLLAQCVASLNGYQAGVIFDIAAADRSLALYPLEESDKAFGQFTQSFTVSATTAAGNPYTT